MLPWFCGKEGKKERFAGRNGEKDCGLGEVWMCVWPVSPLDKQFLFIFRFEKNGFESYWVFSTFILTPLFDTSLFGFFGVILRILDAFR